MRGVSLGLVALALVTFAAGTSAAIPFDPKAVADTAEATLADPEGAIADPGSVTGPITKPGEEAPPAAPDEPDDPGFAEGVADAFRNQYVLAGVAGLSLAAVGLTAFALVGRYVDPKEALENPQRSMLYGFIRGHPGVHLKKLSDEFGMKTSSILWHMRKLEAASLVRSDRANGYRVFYPVEGGQNARQVSRAIANLRNHNAMALFASIEERPGRAAAEVVRGLGIHAGTARWHLKRMREAGLLEELVGATGSRLFPTDLGRRALLAAREGDATPAVAKAPAPVPLLGAHPTPEGSP